MGHTYPIMFLHQYLWGEVSCVTWSGNTNDVWTSILSTEANTTEIDDTYYDTILNGMEHTHIHTYAWKCNIDYWDIFITHSYLCLGAWFYV